mmetsp:Transcript_31222/g.89491  ORF Transcript_31222/g.89491 Transcript_31222/m.89491 type:complete len:573 (-) Transcript_31222:135-1853(-)|eukprot:CAMPEP_0168387730 /NCGR_PEP_ID=MMETSP0228-20121227/16094_1 /TAXON_ID=133427 /ORGANISM="Protoceratium reticulatum, Strain CCCM 535 (=CCMP 1889)" /LENGTH=572 /DNA_ID=CAMNT_0008400971 /DNA_START=58 /DNA_END=1776 /DNA_ORIENTATION=-
MSKTGEIGLDFVQRMVGEIKVLQEEMKLVQHNVADLQSNLKFEEKARETDVGTLHERLSQEKQQELFQRNALEKRQDEFEAKTKTWVGALGKDSVATKEQIGTMETTLNDRIARQAAEAEKRILELEAALPTKSTISDLQRVTSEVGALRGAQDRDRQQAAAAVRGVSDKLQMDIEEFKDQVSRMQLMIDTNKKALVSDITCLETKVDGRFDGLNSKIDNVDTFAKTRAKASDLLAFEPRFGEIEKSTQKLVIDMQNKAEKPTLSSLFDKIGGVTMDVSNQQDKIKALDGRVDKLHQSATCLWEEVRSKDHNVQYLMEEIKTKGTASTVQAVSDRLSGLSTDYQSSQSKAQETREAMVAQLQNFDKAIAKAERQIEADRDRISQCMVALEKEIQTKAARADTDLIGPRVHQQVHDKIELRAGELERNVKAFKEEVLPVKARVEALEAAFPTRADAAELPKLALAIADQAAKHDTLSVRTQEHASSLSKMELHMNHHNDKLAAVETRSIHIEGQVTKKADATEHYTKDHTTDLLRDFYRRDEVDAMLSRVWWRVGDISKGRTTMQAALTNTRN